MNDLHQDGVLLVISFVLERRTDPLSTTDRLTSMKQQLAREMAQLKEYSNVAATCKTMHQLAVQWKPSDIWMSRLRCWRTLSVGFGLNCDDGYMDFEHVQRMCAPEIWPRLFELLVTGTCETFRYNHANSFAPIRVPCENVAAVMCDFICGDEAEDIVLNMS